MPRFVGLALTRASALKTAPVISKGQMHYVTINPRTDGTFRIMVPEGEYRVGRQNGMSPGYALKSVHYGSIDVFNTFLKVSATDTVELRVTLTTPDQ